MTNSPGSTNNPTDTPTSQDVQPGAAEWPDDVEYDDSLTWEDRHDFSTWEWAVMTGRGEAPKPTYAQMLEQDVALCRRLIEEAEEAGDVELAARYRKELSEMHVGMYVEEEEEEEEGDEALTDDEYKAKHPEYEAFAAKFDAAFAGDFALFDTLQSASFDALLDVEVEPLPPTPDGVPKLYSLAELKEKPELTEPPAVVSPLLGRRGQVTLFWGPEKEGKTTAVLSDIVPVLERGERVLLLQFDRNVDQAVRVLLKNPDLTRHENLFAPLNLAVQWDAIEAWIKEVRPSLVVLDTLTNALEALEGKLPEQYEPAKWGPLILRFATLAQKYDCAIVLVAHEIRSGGRYAGSHAIGASVGMVIRFKVKRDGGREIEYKGRWSEPERVVPLDYDPKTEQVRAVDTTLPVWNPLEGLILDAVRKAGVISRKKLRETLEVGKKRCDRTVTTLKADGRLVEKKRGQLRIGEVEVSPDVREAFPDDDDAPAADLSDLEGADHD